MLRGYEVLISRGSNFVWGGSGKVSGPTLESLTGLLRSKLRSGGLLTLRVPTAKVAFARFALEPLWLSEVLLSFAQERETASPLKHFVVPGRTVCPCPSPPLPPLSLSLSPSPFSLPSCTALTALP